MNINDTTLPITNATKLLKNCCNINIIFTNSKKNHMKNMLQLTEETEELIS